MQFPLKSKHLSGEQAHILKDKHSEEQLRQVQEQQKSKPQQDGQQRRIAQLVSSPVGSQTLCTLPQGNTRKETSPKSKLQLEERGGERAKNSSDALRQHRKGEEEIQYQRLREESRVIVYRLY